MPPFTLRTRSSAVVSTRDTTDDFLKKLQTIDTTANTTNTDALDSVVVPLDCQVRQALNSFFAPPTNSADQLPPVTTVDEFRLASQRHTRSDPWWVWCCFVLKAITMIAMVSRVNFVFDININMLCGGWGGWTLLLLSSPVVAKSPLGLYGQIMTDFGLLTVWSHQIGLQGLLVFQVLFLLRWWFELDVRMQAVSCAAPKWALPVSLDWVVVASLRHVMPSEHFQSLLSLFIVVNVWLIPRYLEAVRLGGSGLKPTMIAVALGVVSTTSSITTNVPILSSVGTFLVFYQIITLVVPPHVESTTQCRFTKPSNTTLASARHFARRYPTIFYWNEHFAQSILFVPSVVNTNTNTNTNTTTSSTPAAITAATTANNATPTTSRLALYITPSRVMFLLLTTSLKLYLLSDHVIIVTTILGALISWKLSTVSYVELFLAYGLPLLGWIKSRRNKSK